MPSTIAKASLKEQFQHRVRLVQRAFKEVPGILEEPSWQKFWGTTRTIPLSDISGYLATHRQCLDVTRYARLKQRNDITRFPAPVNTPKGFAAMYAFLHFTRWQEWKQILDQAKIDLLPVQLSGERAVISNLESVISRAEKGYKHPVLIDSPSDVHPDMRGVGSFDGSLDAFRRLVVARQGNPDYNVVFDHPSFIWIERKDSEAELKDYDPKIYGKWVCWMPNFDQTTNLMERLLPSFSEGDLNCAKYFVHTMETGGCYLLVYTKEPGHNRKTILDAASGQPSFFVYDADCYEIEGLAVAAKKLLAQVRVDDVLAVEENIARLLPQIAEPGFGRAQGISEVQRQTMLAVLNMNLLTDSADRYAYLAHANLSGWRNTLGTILPKFLSPDNRIQIRIAIESHRAATRSGDFV